MPGAQEKDLNPDTYIGLSFPIRRDNNNDFKLTKTSLEQAQHNLKNLFLTYPGERVGQPEFGSRIRELCFEQIDDELPTRIEEEVRRTVSTWLPYIIVQEVNTLNEEGDENKIFVQVKYSTTLNPSTLESITVDASYTSTVY
jgi:phage baseplate assembly protein W